jgi:hypothetical protein
MLCKTAYLNSQVRIGNWFYGCKNEVKEERLSLEVNKKRRKEGVNDAISEK